MPNDLPARRGGRAIPAIGAALLAGLCACTPLKIVEDTPESVSIRYDGVYKTLGDATAEANRLCATHGKVAQLRGTETKAALERFAHFNCVSR